MHGFRGWLATAAALVVLVALSSAALWSMQPPPPPRITPAIRRAQSAASSLLAAYYLPASGILARYALPPRRARRTFTPADLWGYSWGLAALEDVARLPGGARFLPVVRRLARNLANYWDAESSPPAYAPTLSPGPEEVKFFDDNAWAGLDLVRAYELTHDTEYLRQAEAVFRYEEFGWDPVQGGIFWDDERYTRNTASTAPTAELAAYLYMDTRKPAYLAWAKRIYAWELSHLVDPRTGQVYGRILASENVNPSAWTYNQGTVIGGGVLLYRATGRPAYLAQARKTASFVLRHGREKDGAFVPPGEFGGVLVDNLQLLYQVAPDPAIRRAVVTSARIAWARARSSRGLFASDWSGPPPETEGHSLLTQTGAVRLLAVAAALAGP